MSENDSIENKKNDFINEVVKKDNRKNKAFVLNLLILLIKVAAAAAVAAFVFAALYPAASSLFVSDSNESERVSIGESSIYSDSVSVDSSSVISDTSSLISDVTEDLNESGSSQVAGDSGDFAEITIEDYENIYSQMNDIASLANKSLVTVTGITSQLDYFNESYENTQESTGLVIAENNSSLFILTYYDILENAEKIQITLEDGSMCDASLCSSDANTGLAVISADLSRISDEIRSKLAVTSLGNSFGVKSGDQIIVIGSPTGYEGFLAYGMITSSSNSISVYDNEYSVLATDIYGSGGGMGVILDLDGDVIGITSPDTDRISGSFVTALAISDVKNLIETLSNSEDRPYVGVMGANVTEQISENTGMPVGILVTSVATDSPAMLSGIMDYDVIIKIGDVSVKTVAQFYSSLTGYSPGDTIDLTVMRKSGEEYSELEFSLTLGKI